MTNVFSDSELRAWIALSQVNGLGHVRLQKLLKRFGSVDAIMRASLAQLQSVPGIGRSTAESIRQRDAKAITATLEWLQLENHHFIPCSHDDYPLPLRHITSAPIALYVHGDKARLKQPQMAIVGSRHPDQYGKENAYRFAMALAQCGITITSGLALGIDACAHQGALAAGGDTLAVMATGIDRIYPTQHRCLAREIANNGCLISEQSLDCPAKAHLFPRRNRIISGLSLGCMVIQASLRSGSLITAKQAMEQGREVYALPGSINNPLSKGCHHLIRQGAQLVESIDEILIELKEVLSGYIDNSNKFTLPKNNEIMSVTGDSVDASDTMAQDRSIIPDSTADSASKHRELTLHTRQSKRRAAKAEIKVASDTNFVSYKQIILNRLQYESATIDTLVDSCELSTNIVSSVLQELELLGEVSLHGGRYSRVQR